MKRKEKKNVLTKIDELINKHPILIGFIISVFAAVFLALLIINRSMIVSNMRFIAFISYVIPGAFAFIFVGLYIGVLMNRKKAKEAMKSDTEIGLKLGSVAFYHSWVKDKNLDQNFEAVKGPCCPVCGEDFWEADRLEKNDWLIFECKKCGNTNGVQLREYEKVKGETELTFQRAYERLKKFKDRLTGPKKEVPVSFGGN